MLESPAFAKRSVPATLNSAKRLGPTLALPPAEFARIPRAQRSSNPKDLGALAMQAALPELGAALLEEGILRGVADVVALARVHPVDRGHVLLLDDRPLELLRRGELAELLAH